MYNLIKIVTYVSDLLNIEWLYVTFYDLQGHNLFYEII